MKVNPVEAHDDESPFACVSEKAFKTIDDLDTASGLLMLGFFSGLLFPFLYLIVFPASGYWLTVIIRLKLRDPILFKWRSFYSGVSPKEIMDMSEKDERLRKITKIQGIFIRVCIAFVVSSLATSGFLLLMLAAMMSP